MNKPETDSGAPPPSLLQTAMSVIAAFFGVQSRQNRERDFSRGKPAHFIVLGLVMTALFVLGLIVVVKLVLRHAGL